MATLFTDAKEPGNPIIFANSASLDLTGYDREEVLGQSFNFLMARAADPDSLARIDIAFAGAPKGGSEICYRCKDGDEFWSAILISPVRDESGELFESFAGFRNSLAGGLKVAGRRLGARRSKIFPNRSRFNRFSTSFTFRPLWAPQIPEGPSACTY
jgi:PAS domain S-box-containing protein